MLCAAVRNSVADESECRLYCVGTVVIGLTHAILWCILGANSAVLMSLKHENEYALRR
jgi:hypothetical protein